MYTKKTSTMCFNFAVVNITLFQYLLARKISKAIITASPPRQWQHCPYLTTLLLIKCMLSKTICKAALAVSFKSAKLAKCTLTKVQKKQLNSLYFDICLKFFIQKHSMTSFYYASKFCKKMIRSTTNLKNALSIYVDKYLTIVEC